jgi:hypothetical protein
LPSFSFATDACLTGGGAHLLHDWCYFNWSIDFPHHMHSHINVLEMLTVLLAIKRWGSSLSGTMVTVRSDNMTTLAAVTKGTSRSREIMPLVRELFWLSVRHDFVLKCVFLPGVDNVLADRISRVDDLKCANEARYLLSGMSEDRVLCADHMSKESYLCLQERWIRHLRLYN